MKIGRYEATPQVGFVTNDPFINRYLLGAGFGYHVTEIFAVEAQGIFSPDLNEADWKPITRQIINENQVTPDISKIQFYGTVQLPVLAHLREGRRHRSEHHQLRHLRRVRNRRRQHARRPGRPAEGRRPRRDTSRSLRSTRR